jgi:phosphate transport system permease protein
MSKTPSQVQASRFKRIRINEGLFKWFMTNMALLNVLLLAGIFITLLIGSIPAIRTSGYHFLVDTRWDPLSDHYGALPFVVGTLITSFLALLISFPFSIALALLLGEFYKKGIVSDIFKNIIELMAGVPSVIYGFGALYFLTPQIAALEHSLGVPAYGVGILAASIVLAIMIVPYWTSVAREVISLTPNDIREAAYSLGATRFEVIKFAIIPYTRTGIVAGMLLALGRALGETMAVTMVIGNTNKLPKSIFDIFATSNTMASVIANEYNEATTGTYISSLVEVALLLFVLSTVLNLAGKQIIKSMTSK